MSRLDFSVSDLNLPATRDKTRRASISGVQDKVQLKRVRGKFVVVDSGGDYILSPSLATLPQNSRRTFLRTRRLRWTLRGVFSESRLRNTSSLR